jgi:hypothetical protein
VYRIEKECFSCDELIDPVECYKPWNNQYYDFAASLSIFMIATMIDDGRDWYLLRFSVYVSYGLAEQIICLCLNFTRHQLDSTRTRHSYAVRSNEALFWRMGQ